MPVWKCGAGEKGGCQGIFFLLGCYRLFQRPLYRKGATYGSTNVAPGSSVFHIHRGSKLKGRCIVRTDGVAYASVPAGCAGTL
ncbi:hypothetical protein D3C72_1909160 [compost metagenome]